MAYFLQKKSYPLVRCWANVPRGRIRRLAPWEFRTSSVCPEWASTGWSSGRRRSASRACAKPVSSARSLAIAYRSRPRPNSFELSPSRSSSFCRGPPLTSAQTLPSLTSQPAVSLNFGATCPRWLRRTRRGRSPLRIPSFLSTRWTRPAEACRSQKSCHLPAKN